MIIPVGMVLLLIAWIILGTTYFKWHAFWVLLTGSIFLGIALKIPPVELSALISQGVGKTFEQIGLLILFGTWIGIGLQRSGATWTIAHSLLRAFPERRSGLAINLLGFLIGIPVFCDAAFVVLSSINRDLHQKTGLNLAGLTIALSTGLFASHVLVPPTPGPLAAAANLELQHLTGLVLGGTILALVLSLVGWLFSRKIKIEITLPDDRAVNYLENPPGFFVSILPILLPLVLMGSGTIPPTMALLSGVLAVLFLVNDKKWWLEEGFKQSAPILFVTAMGGTLGLIMRELPLADMFLNWRQFAGPVLLIPFLMASFLKIAQGSSTVAIITTSAIFFPLMAQFGLETEIDKVWVILSIGVGSMTVSHANDSYFWIVSQLSGLDIKNALKTHTMASLVQGMVGIFILMVSYFIYSLF
jgi:gluconate:H+ symporter, GntP family